MILFLNDLLCQLCNLSQHDCIIRRTIDTLNKSQNEKERSRLDADLELQSVKYKLEQEREARAMSERLCGQLKDQLNRSEKKLTR